MNITTLGAGAFGTALATILRTNHHTVTFYDPFRLPAIALDKALATAEVILIAAPSHTIPALAPSLSRLPQPIILATKGLLSLAPFAPHPVSLISGPAFAEDLDQQKSTTLTVTSPLARTLLATPWLHLEITPDTTGVLLCGSLKTVYALGAGLLASPPGYIDKALTELKTYLISHGASASTADLACGIGDLTLTCTDPRSRNFAFGRAFRDHPDQPPTTTVEGLSTLGALTDYKKYPILRSIRAVFARQPRALEKLDRLIHEN